jgi:hypothetical protein
MRLSLVILIFFTCSFSKNEIKKNEMTLTYIDCWMNVDRYLTAKDLIYFEPISCKINREDYKVIIAEIKNNVIDTFRTYLDCRVKLNIKFKNENFQVIFDSYGHYEFNNQYYSPSKKLNTILQKYMKKEMCWITIN